MSISLGWAEFRGEEVDGVTIDCYLDVGPSTGERRNPRARYQVRFSSGQSRSFWAAVASDDPREMAVLASAGLAAGGFRGVAYAVNRHATASGEPPEFTGRLLGDGMGESTWVVSSAWVRPGTATWVTSDRHGVGAGLPGGGFVHAEDGGDGMIFGDGVAEAWLGHG